MVLVTPGCVSHVLSGFFPVKASIRYLFVCYGGLGGLVVVGMVSKRVHV